ncbi:MAG: hypothetical protein AMXMBFR64_58090 [Myxococcales bacterium]
MTRLSSVLAMLRLSSVLVSLALVACSDADLTPAPSAQGPYPLARSLAWVDSGMQRVVLLDASASTPRIRAVDLPGAPGDALIPLDRSRVVVPVPERELVVAVSDDGAATTRQWELGAPFDGVAVSDDGEALVAYFKAGSSSGVFQNASAVAAIDATKAQGADNPARRTVRSFGTAPDSVIVSPALTLGGVERRVALVRSVSHLAVLDLSDAASRDVSVPLVTPDSSVAIVPDQVEFAAGPDALWVFLRAAASPDIFALRITARTDHVPGEDTASLAVSLNVFYSGLVPSQMMLLAGGAAPRLLVVNQQSQSAALIDAASAAVETVPLGAAVTSAVRTVGTARDLVLLWDGAGALTTLRMLDLDAHESGKGKVVTTIKIAKPVSAATPIEGRTQVVLTHKGAYDAYGWGDSPLSVLNLEDGSVTPFTGTGALRGMVRAPSGPDLLIATVVEGEGWLVRLDLDTLHAKPMPLGSLPTSLALLPAAKRLVVDHGGSVGSVTLWAADKVEGEGASVGGFLLDGILDRED